MNKDTQIIIIGLGSIGKRHLKNLIALGYKSIFLVRRDTEKLSEFPTLKVYNSITSACNSKKIDVAIICTPTSKHYEDFIEVSQNKIHNVYLEKPIASSVYEAKLIDKTARENVMNVTVGYDLHFDLGLTKVKELLKEKTIGKVCSFQVEVGQYLPDWRPHEDYREGMSAKKSLGGGVMLDLVHEFDYVNWIFGPIVNVFGKNVQCSNLEIDTEDVSVNIVETKDKVLGIIYLDYLQKELSRTCKIVGDFGTIIWNYKDSTVKWMTNSNTVWKEFEYKKTDRNDRFISIMNSFMKSSISHKDKRLSSIEGAIKSLGIVEVAKKSNNENKFMNL